MPWKLFSVDLHWNAVILVYFAAFYLIPFAQTPATKAKTATLIYIYIDRYILLSSFFSVNLAEDGAITVMAGSVGRARNFVCANTRQSSWNGVLHLKQYYIHFDKLITHKWCLQFKNWKMQNLPMTLQNCFGRLLCFLSIVKCLKWSNFPRTSARKSIVTTSSGGAHNDETLTWGSENMNMITWKTKISKRCCRN